MNIFKKLYLEHFVCWYCDNCGIYLNRQIGFKVDSGHWVCSQCGYINDVTAEYVGQGNRLEQQRFIEKEKLERQRLIEKEQLENKRKNTECLFNEPLTKSVFENLVFRISRYYKRLSVNIADTTVCGIVRSVSGASFWEFSADFNDFGNITGKYYSLTSNNNDSNIPYLFCEELKQAIIDYINQEHKDT